MMDEIVKRERPTLVNAHAPVPGLADLTARLARSCPFVLTYHTGPMTKNRLAHELLVSSYQRFVLPRTIHRAIAVITPSDYVRSTLPAAPQGPTVTIHPGVDLDRFTPGPADRSDTPARALFVGSLDKAARYKNLPSLLHALRLLKNAGHEIPLTVAGDGDARPGHEALARSLGLADQVRFAGNLTDEALVTAYQQATFKVLPTLFDSFATVLAEAMACGRPVIATDTGGIPELVEHGNNGLLVPPGDHEKLATAIGTLATDTGLRRRLATGARTTATERLDWRHQARKTIELFQRVTGLPARLTGAATS
jgi:glycosyltransferase involved in cell wall biosynthesis